MEGRKESKKKGLILKSNKWRSLVPRADWRQELTSWEQMRGNGMCQ